MGGRGGALDIRSGKGATRSSVPLPLSGLNLDKNIPHYRQKKNNDHLYLP